MAFPKDIGVIETMMGIPVQEDRSEWYESFRPLVE